MAYNPPYASTPGIRRGTDLESSSNFASTSQRMGEYFNDVDVVPVLASTAPHQPEPPAYERPVYRPLVGMYAYEAPYGRSRNLSHDW
jgi:hypothetical protein